jgi:SAM-dependent methyltransferase
MNTVFSFGRNWQSFLKCIDEPRIKIAEQSLLEFMSVEDLKGKTFVDIGCGSGLFSLAAYRLGAERIVSFDVDPFSVECCKYLQSNAGNPSNWVVETGSILDEQFVQTLGGFDVVYSWGVLHHTGKMWEAVENAAKLVNPGGLYYIALYNKLLTHNGAEHWIHRFWTQVKITYNQHPNVGNYVFMPLAMSAYMAIVLLRGENPVAHLRNYRSHRGMSWVTDAVDWLGGYPYEYATVEEVFKFIKTKFAQFALENLKLAGGRGLNWYLFKNGKPGGALV